MGFLDELVKLRKNNPSPYPVYIGDVEVGEVVVPPLPWWAVVLVVVGGFAGAAALFERLRRWLK